jgi:hypothetical protein
MWTLSDAAVLVRDARFRDQRAGGWDEGGQHWRRLRVVWPSYLATHSTEQTLYFDEDGLLTRHDYDVEISGGTNAAHYVFDYDEVAGIRLPTRHRIFPRTPDGESLAGGPPSSSR